MEKGGHGGGPLQQWPPRGQVSAGLVMHRHGISYDEAVPIPDLDQEGGCLRPLDHAETWLTP